MSRADFPDLSLPVELCEAVNKRQVQFLVGRYCAVQALRQLGGGSIPEVVGRGSRGAPIWPAGVTGSITHTDSFASAAVAWTHHAGALGIDSERIMRDPQADSVSPAILVPAEMARAQRVPVHFSVWATLV